MALLAACLAGFGGLLLEMVFVRQHGLLLGNTAGAAALVLAVFLAGLGLGGVWLPRSPVAVARPLSIAALLYGGVALSGPVAQALLAALPPLSGLQGAVLCLVVPGVPALLMGGAFPLLFVVANRRPRAQAEALVGSNLLGSVAAAFVGGNFLIPDLGMQLAAWLGSAAYAAAALLVGASAWIGRSPDASAELPPLPRVGGGELAAAAAGLFALGLEVLMLRRLPFFLDGFQPTLSGVLGACLLALTLGASVGPPLFRRLAGERAAAWSVGAGVLLAALGLHESVAPAIGRSGIESDLGFHLRIAGAALVAAGPACFCLGATVPLCLGAVGDAAARAALAGRLFFCQGVGSLAGALAAGHALPALLPTRFFDHGVAALGLCALVLVAPSLGAVRTAALALPVVLLAALGVTGGSALRPDDAPVAGSRYDRPGRYRYLAHRTDAVVTASVVYDRQAHGLALFTDEFRAAYIDADSGYMKVLGHLPFLLREELGRVAVVALGTGTTANAVHLWPDPRELHVVEISPAVYSLVDWFARQGPALSQKRAPFAADPRTRVHVTDGRRFIARRPPGSLDLISMEPLLPYAPGTVPLYTEEFYRLCGEALADGGLMVQWVPTHAMPEAYFRTLLATFAKGFAHHSVWLVDHSTLLVGSRRPHLPEPAVLQQRFAAMPEAARRDLHEAGIASAEDLFAAFVTDAALAVCKDPPILRDDRPFLESIGHWSAARRQAFLPSSLEILARGAARPPWPDAGWPAIRGERLRGLLDRARGAAGPDGTDLELAVLALGRARAAQPHSALLFGELARARRELLERDTVRALQAGTLDRLARRIEQHLRRDPGSALLFAARAVLEGETAAQRAAALRALALDPTVYDTWPALRLPQLAAELAAWRGPFEDLAELPEGQHLVARGVADTEDGVAFRARFRVPVGYALLELLAARPLAPGERAALHAVLDPALLELAARRVVGRAGDVAAEVLPLCRSDLALPEAARRLAAGSVAQRIALAHVLGGRRGDLPLLASLLRDGDLEVRRAAAVALHATVQDAVAFDPQWGPSQREAAAQAVEGLGR